MRCGPRVEEEAEEISFPEGDHQCCNNKWGGQGAEAYLVGTVTKSVVLISVKINKDDLTIYADEEIDVSWQILTVHVRAIIFGSF